MQFSVNEKIVEIRRQGYCVLKAVFPSRLVEDCRQAFWPRILDYIASHRDAANRGPHRHFLAMPFQPPIFAPDFFFNPDILSIARGLMGSRIVADQWGIDIPLRGSEYQRAHVDYQRPLFEESPDLPLPVYMLVVSFGLVPIGPEHGPLEIAAGTHLMPREDALRLVENGDAGMRPVLLDPGDVLIRHPWAIHRGSPNTTHTPRALVTIRYVRHWYSDSSRDVDVIPRTVWEALSPEEQSMVRFPIES